MYMDQSGFVFKVKTYKLLVVFIYMYIYRIKSTFMYNISEISRLCKIIVTELKGTFNSLNCLKSKQIDGSLDIVVLNFLTPNII